MLNIPDSPDISNGGNPVRKFYGYFKQFEDYIPSVFLLLGIIIGGLRTFNAWAVFLVAFWLYIILFRTDFSIQKSGLWGIFLLWLGISVFGSMEPLNSTFHLAKYVTFIGFYVLLKNSGKKAMGIWFITLFLISTVSFLTVIIQTIIGVKAVGMLPPNPNYTAGILAVSVSGLIAGIFETEEKKLKTTFLILALFFLFPILLINSRGALLSILIAIYFVLFQKRHFKPALYLTVAILLLAVLIPQDILSVLLKIQDIHSFQRINIWKTALNAIYEFPFLGAGLGCFENVFSVFKFSYSDGISFFGHSALHSHSEILNLAAESGIAGALIFLIAFISCGQSVRKNDSLKNICFIMVITLFVQSLVDVTFFLGTISLMFWGSLAMSQSYDADKTSPFVTENVSYAPTPNFRRQQIAPKELDKSATTKPDKKTKFNRLLTFSICIFVVLSLALRFNYQKWVQCSRSNNDSHAKAVCISKSLKITPLDLTLLLEEIKSSILNPPNNYAIALGLAENAALKSPKTPFFYHLESEIYYRIGDFKRAGEKALAAISIEPNFLAPRILLMKIFLKNKNYEPAKEQMEKIQSILARSAHAPKTDYNKLLLNLDNETHNRIKTILWETEKTGKITASDRT